MKMNTIAAFGAALSATLGAALFVAAQANAGGMPPDYEIDANGDPLDGIEPVAAVTGPMVPLDEPTATLTTAAMDDLQFAASAMPIEISSAIAIVTGPLDPAKDHR